MGARYERDFYSWAMEQAALVRAGRFDQLDLANIAEELETMGRSEAVALKSSYRVLLTHLLKWQHQPALRSKSWRDTIGRERINISEHLEENPGLKSRQAELFAKAYQAARREAALETGLPLAAFPPACPYAVEQAVSDDFWPEPA